jgi:hypothetical protein
MQTNGNWSDESLKKALKAVGVGSCSQSLLAFKFFEDHYSL